MVRETLLILMLGLAACGGTEEEPGQFVVVPDSSAPAPGAATPAEMAATSAMPTGFDTVAARGERPLLRESYGWSGGGRDPFRPLLTLALSGPDLVDLSLVSVIYQRSDPSRSMAIFRDNGSGKRYTVSPGDRIPKGGKLLVASISTGTATLRMNDFGTTREQTYTIRQTLDVTP
ncbi:MAG TPA: hypothetical protein VFN22_01625 [Gemmatimonadales bacterium]|nr:hypothetical protein [Gemmatimonadales bacterium]